MGEICDQTKSLQRKRIYDLMYQKAKQLGSRITKAIRTLHYADDLTLLAPSEDKLQRSIHNLKLISEKYSMEISIDKTKLMAFCSKDPVPSKICINNQILVRVNVFKYLGFNLSFLENLDISEKITRYNKSIVIINSVMKPSLVQNIPICLYIKC